MIHNPATFGLAYLATPYSKYPGGIEIAFIEASKLAARLLHTGMKVYSPIAHTHPLARYGNIDPLDHSIWMPFDEAMMTAAQTLIVAHMDGWQESKGIAHEVRFFEAAGKPIYDLDPSTLAMTSRARLSQITHETRKEIPAHRLPYRPNALRRQTVESGRGKPI